jgi:hypothetical protein
LVGFLSQRGRVTAYPETIPKNCGAVRIGDDSPGTRNDGRQVGLAHRGDSFEPWFRSVMDGSRSSFVESVYSTLQFGGDELRVRRFCGSTLIGFLALLAHAPGQTGSVGISASAPSRSERPGLRQELPSEAVSIEGLIRLDVVVSDQAGKSVEGLKRADFKVVENGVTQSVVAFRNPNDAPAGSDDGLSVILLLDTLDLPGSLGQQRSEGAV